MEFLKSLFSGNNKISSKRIVGVPFGLAAVFAFFILLGENAGLSGAEKIEVYKYTLTAVFALLGVGVVEGFVKPKDPKK